MIKNLYIQNFVLIDELNLDFTSGFSAFTGETGAGKSILIDAISLLKAERASASLVMKGKEKAIVEGTFDLSHDEHACRVLQEAGFDSDHDVTFTRDIAANSKSTARIDHRIVTLALLKDVLANEIDIHGQRDNAYLLNTSLHIHLLDRFLQDDAQLQKVMQAWDAWKALETEKEQALSDTYNENDLEYFRYEIQEIEEADLKEGEEEELEAKEKQYHAIQDSFEKLNQIFTLYDDSVSNNLYDMRKWISALPGDDQHLDEIQNQFSDAYYSMTDALESLRQMKDEMDMSEDDINAMEERLFTIQKLKRKYGHDIPAILAKKDELQKQVDRFEHRQEFLEEINAKIRKAKQAYDKEDHILHDIRLKGIPHLNAQVNARLKELMLPNARFQVEMITGAPTNIGSDHVQFMVAMNAGEDLKPLAKTASGGELARLMLGLKVIFTHLQGIETVIFDEIDTGVSGKVAGSIGKEMKALSNDCQVFAVTHLAPVAAWADRQYLVAKHVKNDVTRTTVSLLDEAQRIDQLALIASGSLSDASRQAAKELLERSHA